MKCQKCEKTATFHITELTSSVPQEHHLCEEHARQYLNESSEPGEGSLASVLPQGGMPQGLPKNVTLDKASAELQELDMQTCPICGMSFYDFRSRGRLGCPNDYDCFAKQLDILILNIHGDTEHVGKSPKRAGGETSRRTLLIKLRRDLSEAVRYEEYERASKLRDKIKEMEAE